MKIAVITDTDASLPLALSEAYGIIQVPIMIHFGTESLHAVYDLDDETVFRRIDAQGALPTTSAPSPGQFSTAYQQALDGGAEAILCITVSSEVSATYTAARTAADEFPQARIQVLDSRSLSIGQGFMVLSAAQALAAGASMEEAIASAESVRERTHLFVVLDTLKYLAMSGRVGSLAAGLANVLNVKPILTIRDGKLDMLEKVRTRKKAWARIAQLTNESLGGRPIEQAALLNVVNPPERKDRFLATLRQTLPLPEDLLEVELTPGLSVHAGSGVLGIGIVAAE